MGRPKRTGTAATEIDPRYPVTFAALMRRNGGRTDDENDRDRFAGIEKGTLER